MKSQTMAIVVIDNYYVATRPLFDLDNFALKSAVGITFFYLYPVALLKFTHFLS